jgi:hypothetical protein
MQPAPGFDAMSSVDADLLFFKKHGFGAIRAS